MVMCLREFLLKEEDPQQISTSNERYVTDYKELLRSSFELNVFHSVKFCNVCLDTGRCAATEAPIARMESIALDEGSASNESGTAAGEQVGRGNRALSSNIVRRRSSRGRRPACIATSPSMWAAPMTM